MDIKKKDFDFNLLKSFYWVAELKSFSKAAEKLFISQPAISYSIKRLESDLNSSLFTRNGKTIELTETGTLLKGYVEKAFENIGAGYNQIITGDDELSGNLKIGVYSHIGAFYLSEHLATFMKKNPKVRLTVYNSTFEEMHSQFKDGEIDILIMHYPAFGQDKGYIEEKLIDFKSSFFSTRFHYEEFLKRSGGDRKILDFPLLLPIEGHSTSDSLKVIFSDNNMVLKTNMYFYTSEMINSLVKQGLGIGWGITKMIEAEVKRDELFLIPVSFELPKMSFGITYKSNVSKTGRSFINYLKSKNI